MNDYYLRGQAIMPYAADRASTLEAQRFFYKAIEYDENFASAHAAAANAYLWLKVNGYAPTGEQEVAAVLRHVTKVAEGGQDDAAALALVGIALAYVGFDLDGGIALIDRALKLNPNLADAWHFSGWARFYRGDTEIAIEHLARAMRLSPLDPRFFGMQAATAYAHFFAGRYVEATLWAERAYQRGPHFLGTSIVGAASNALAGRMDEARKIGARILQLYPGYRVSMQRHRMPLRRPEDLARLEEGLRKAGLPE
jgi:tetratricopeptide (TPR) repeat protein